MRRREFITLLVGAAAWPLAARAQQPGGMRRIGVLSAGGSGSAAQTLFGVLTDTLRTLGWVEGQNVQFERRLAFDHNERLADLAAELVRLDAHVILAFGTLAPLAAKQATSTIPIVMAA